MKKFPASGFNFQEVKTAGTCQAQLGAAPCKRCSVGAVPRPVRPINGKGERARPAAAFGVSPKASPPSLPSTPSREKFTHFPFPKPENLTLEPDLFSSPLPLAFSVFVF